MKSVEELLKIRFKVIAGYPDTTFKVGDILTPDVSSNGGEYEDATYRMYPHLFLKMEWWEGLKREELPMYVVLDFPDSKIKKVEKWEGLNLNGAPIFTYINKVGYPTTASAESYLPTTEAEYLSYIAANQKEAPM